MSAMFSRGLLFIALVSVFERQNGFAPNTALCLRLPPLASNRKESRDEDSNCLLSLCRQVTERESESRSQAHFKLESTAPPCCHIYFRFDRELHNQLASLAIQCLRWILAFPRTQLVSVCESIPASAPRQCWSLQFSALVNFLLPLKQLT